MSSPFVLLNPKVLIRQGASMQSVEQNCMVLATVNLDAKIVSQSNPYNQLPSHLALVEVFLPGRPRYIVLRDDLTILQK